MSDTTNIKKDLPYKNKGDLTTGPVWTHLAKLSLPMVWGLFAVISVQVVDTYFIGQLGTTQLAAITFTFPVTMTITHLLFGMNIAMSSVVSRLIGEKRQDDVRRVVLHGLMMAFSVSLIVAGVCYLTLEPLFMMLGANAQTWPHIADYMPLWLLAFVILSLPVNGNSAIRASGNAMWPALVMTISAVINLILDPILIFGWFGLPAMGVQGAAIATLVAYICACLSGLYILVFKKKLVALDGLNLDTFKDSFKRLAIIAVPAGITNIVMPVTNAVIVALLAAYGAQAVAAYGIVSRIEAMAMLAVMALAIGMAPVVGQNWGARLYNRVHQTINMAISFNFGWSFMVAFVLYIFAERIAGSFSDDAAVIYYAVLFFKIVPFSYAFGNLIFGWSSAFNAMGMPARSFVMIVVKAVCVTIPAVVVAAHYAGVIGIFAAIAAVNVVVGLFFHVISWRACSKREQNKK